LSVETFSTFPKGDNLMKKAAILLVTAVLALTLSTPAFAKSKHHKKHHHHHHHATANAEAPAR
jgi:hypothetical protein